MDFQPPYEPPVVPDTITSLMDMADTMEALLPPDCDLTPPSLPDCISSVTTVTTPAASVDKLSVPDSSPPRARPRAPDAVSTSYLPLDQLPMYEHTLPSVVPTCNTHNVETSSTTSPVSIRDPTAFNTIQTIMESIPRSITKLRKTPRKPKTYSKPVASRFCHICSRMPRRGQGAATCRRMAEGLCRKIVCEQCLREQGWDVDDIVANPTNWLCPHCADNCPARSQCHIYNRINARRKRAGKQTSVAQALASADVLLGPYGHLLQQQNAPQILQPPPNFRLNLPPHFSQQ